MKNLMSYFKLLILMLSLALIFTGCLESGEDEGDSATKTPATLSEDSAPKSAGAAMQAANVTGAFSGLGGIGSSSVSSDTDAKSPLGRIIDKALSITKVQRSTADIFAQGSIPQTTDSCPDGGYITFSASWIGPDQPSGPSEMVDFTATITLNSCQEGTETVNGSYTIAFSGPLDNPTSLTLTAPILTFIDTATNDNLTMTNLTMSVTVPTMSGEEITGGTFSLDGALYGMVEGDPINQEYDDFQIVLSSDVTGEMLSLSGSLKAICIGGWVTITTNTPLFVPIGAGCPTVGEISITSGGNTVRVVVASNYTITVYFNDTLIQTYTDCEEVDGLCTG